MANLIFKLTMLSALSLSVLAAGNIPRKQVAETLAWKPAVTKKGDECKDMKVKLNLLKLLVPDSPRLADDSTTVAECAESKKTNGSDYYVKLQKGGHSCELTFSMIMKIGKTAKGDNDQLKKDLKECERILSQPEIRVEEPIKEAEKPVEDNTNMDVEENTAVNVEEPIEEKINVDIGASVEEETDDLSNMPYFNAEDEDFRMPSTPKSPKNNVAPSMAGLYDHEHNKKVSFDELSALNTEDDDFNAPLTPGAPRRTVPVSWEDEADMYFAANISEENDINEELITNKTETSNDEAEELFENEETEVINRAVDVPANVDRKNYSKACNDGDRAYFSQKFRLVDDKHKFKITKCARNNLKKEKVIVDIKIQNANCSFAVDTSAKSGPSRSHKIRITVEDSFKNYVKECLRKSGGTVYTEAEAAKAAKNKDKKKKNRANKKAKIAAEHLEQSKKCTPPTEDDFKKKFDKINTDEFKYIIDKCTATDASHQSFIVEVNMQGTKCTIPFTGVDTNGDFRVAVKKCIGSAIINKHVHRKPNKRTKNDKKSSPSKPVVAESESEDENYMNRIEVSHDEPKRRIVGGVDSNADKTVATNLFAELILSDFLEGKIVYTQNVESVSSQVVNGAIYNVVYKFNGKKCQLKAYFNASQQKYQIYHDKIEKTNEYFIKNPSKSTYTEKNCFDVFGSAIGQQRFGM